MTRSGEWREVLVRGPNWLGDLVMTTPALRALRAGLPGARITLHVRAELVPLLEGAPFVDRVLPLTPRRGGVRALLGAARQLRAEGRYDLGFCVPDSFSSALLMRAAGVRLVVGYRRGGRSVLLHHAVAPARDWGPRRLVSRERYALGLVEAMGCPAHGLHTELFSGAADEAALAGLLESAVLADPSQRIVGLAPGASYGPAKRWPVSHFARLGDALAARGARIVLIGAPDEAPLTASVAGAMRAPALDLAGQLDLRALKALVRRLALLVGNDAGARHVAAAFDVPCLVVFGPTSVAKTDANLAGVSVFETDAACRPCYRRVCPIDHRCLREITAESVSSAALRVLDGLDARAPGAGIAECAG